jgi:CHAD domain-containing protein
MIPQTVRRRRAARTILSKDPILPSPPNFDIKPGSYSTKFAAALDPAMRSDEAMKLLLRFLLQVMRINEGNIEKDLDTEFLHDFRVALRRARSALSEMGQVFPPEVTDRFEKVLAIVGRISNPLRDLDVFLQDESNHKAMLPAALRDDIDPLFKYLRKERSRAFWGLVQHLRSKKYRKNMGSWITYLSEKTANSRASSDARLPIGDVARIRILRKYRRIVDRGNEVLVNPKDKKLHLLRLACKELRYLLEFFASLFPREKVDVVIQQLKKLQDLLGRFNDLRIQEEYLLTVAGEFPRRGKQGTRTLLAIGSLIGTLDREKQTVKEAFAKTFGGYASRANQELFRELVAGPIPATPSRSSSDLP